MNGENRQSKAWLWLSLLGSQLRDTYRLGVSIAWLCPPIFALIVLTELAQHAYEIELGLHAADPAMPAGAELDIFWRFAYVKIAGLMLGMLLTVRFWMRDASLRRTLRTGPGEWARLGLVMLVYGLFAAFTELGRPALRWLGVAETAAARADMAVDLLLLVPQILLLPWFLAAVGGDAGMTVARSARASLRGLVTLLVLLPAAFGPAAALHWGLHAAATGASPVPLWSLMVVDSLVVGLIGTLLGSALYIFHRDSAGAGPRP